MEPSLHSASPNKTKIFLEFLILCPKAIPHPIPKPCPSAPEVISTPGLEISTCHPIYFPAL